MSSRGGDGVIVAVLDRCGCDNGDVDGVRCPPGGVVARMIDDEADVLLHPRASEQLDGCCGVLPCLAAMMLAAAQGVVLIAVESKRWCCCRARRGCDSGGDVEVAVIVDREGGVVDVARDSRETLGGPFGMD